MYANQILDQFLSQLQGLWVQGTKTAFHVPLTRLLVTANTPTSNRLHGKQAHDICMEILEMKADYELSDDFAQRTFNLIELMEAELRKHRYDRYP